MQTVLSNYATLDKEEIELKRVQLEKQTKEIELLKQKLEEHFKFEIPKYIIIDIIENEDYQHFCLMINLAVINERLTKENGKILTEGIKDMCNIKNQYSKLEIHKFLYE